MLDGNNYLKANKLLLCLKDINKISQKNVCSFVQMLN